MSIFIQFSFKFRWLVESRTGDILRGHGREQIVLTMLTGRENGSFVSTINIQNWLYDYITDGLTIDDLLCNNNTRDNRN